MSGRRVRIGLAGAGWVTEHHLDAYRHLRDRASVVAIADPVRAAAEARAARYGIAEVYGSVEEMLDGTRLDAVDIAAPREQHVPLCRLAARHGLAILCQKPLAPTLEEAERLVAELGGRVRLMVHDNWRFRPHYRQAHEWIRGGRIGRLRGALMTIFTSGLLPDESGALPALERQPMLAGLERMLLMEVMIHHVDTLRFLLGPLALTAARLGRRCPRIRGEDRAALFLVDDDGAAVSLLGDFMAHGYPPQQVDRLEIFGSEGSIFLRDDRLRLVGGAEQTVELDLQADYKGSYRAAIAHFLDRLADGGAFETSAEDHLETLGIVEAAYRTGL
jgi:predicted dehydrogenase